MTNAEKKRLLKKSQRQLNAKLRLEKRFAKRLRQFIRNQNAQVVEHFEKFGVRFDASMNVDVARVLLENHYNDVVDLFYRDVVKEANTALSGAGADKVNRNDPLILAALAAFISRESSEGAQRMVERSNKDIDIAIGTGRTVDQVRESLDSVTLRRSVALASEHTQRAAEGAKAETSTAVSRVTSAALFTVGKTMTQVKTWMTKADNNVRAEHRGAQFQTVLATLPFFVGGEQLMFPGDMSMGASVWNVANCRCSAIYSFQIV